MNPVTQFTQSIATTSHSTELIESLGEVALDSFLTDGLIRDIPIIGTAMNLVRAGNAVGGYFFAKKILAFLSEIDPVPPEKRLEFLTKHCSDEAGSDHVGEAVLMILESIDDLRLAKMLGRAFAKFMQEEIGRVDFDWHVSVIKSLNPYLLGQLKRYYDPSSFGQVDVAAAIQLANLYLLNVVQEQPDERDRSNKISRRFEGTNFGRRFYDWYLI